jgi:activator of HSP90 ATPase
MKKQGQPIIREKLAEYIRSLKEEFAQGLILPTKNVVTTTNTQSTNISKPLPNIPVATNQNKSAVMEMRDLQVQDSFKCTKVELFQAFCDFEKVKAFTHNSVSKYDCKKGGFFSLFSDNITGRFLDVVPHERLDMLWRFKSWPSDHYSRVSISFKDDTDQTNLIISQTGVPAQFYDNTMVCERDFHLNNYFFFQLF